MTIRTIQGSLLIWVGDALAILLVSVIGFLTHGQGIGLRFLTTYLPLLLAWSLLAPWLGLYRAPFRRNIDTLLKVMIAAVFAASFAAFLRAVWLSAAILPVFVAVLCATSALGMMIWRIVLSFLTASLPIRDNRNG